MPPVPPVPVELCQYCGAVHAPNTQYGSGCPFVPESWPVELQAELQNDRGDGPVWRSVPWPRGRGP